MIHFLRHISYVGDFNLLIMKAIITAIVIFLSFSIFAQTGYEITLSVSNQAGGNVVFGHYYGNNLMKLDSCQLDSNSRAVFAGKENLAHGLYFVRFANKKMFNILIDKDQHFSIDLDSENLNNFILRDAKSSLREFLSFQKFLYFSQLKTKEYYSKALKATNSDSAKYYGAKYKNIREETDKYRKLIIGNNASNFTGVFLSASQELTLPETIKDSLEVYKYYKNNYFHRFNLSDERLLRTPIYENKVNVYLTRVVAQNPDSVWIAVDSLVSLSRNSKLTKNFMLVYLHNFLLDSKMMGADDIFVKFCEKHYLQNATWLKRKQRRMLKQEIERIKPTMLGQKAAELTLENDQGEYISLHQSEAEYIILWFWEPDCAHCAETTPRLYMHYQSSLKALGVEVFAVYVRSDRKKWDEFIQTHCPEWINVWDPRGFGELFSKFNVRETPMIVVLNKNKEIIAKNISENQATDIILNLVD